MSHKPTTFQLTAFGILENGSEQTVVTRMADKAGRVTSSDFQKDLPEAALKYATDSLPWLKEMAASSGSPLASVKIRVGLAKGERAPPGFRDWELRQPPTYREFEITSRLALVNALQEREGAA